MDGYAIVIFYSDEEDCFIADIPDLRFCSAFGETPQEALAEALVAKDFWIEPARQNSDSIPPVVYRPAM